jgi:hypothetical protein
MYYERHFKVNADLIFVIEAGLFNNYFSYKYYLLVSLLLTNYGSATIYLIYDVQQYEILF